MVYSQDTVTENMLGGREKILEAQKKAPFQKFEKRVENRVDWKQMGKWDWRTCLDDKEILRGRCWRAGFPVKETITPVLVRDDLFNEPEAVTKPSIVPVSVTQPPVEMKELVVA
jgi:hypothetical protein